MRSIISLRGICSLALRSGRLRSLSSATRGSAQRPRRSPNFGTIDDAPAGYENNPEAIELARFAVAEHNTKANAALEFERVVKVRGQLVAGTMHYFTIEVKEGGAKKLYEAKVWVRVWENFRGLEEFKPTD